MKLSDLSLSLRHYVMHASQLFQVTKLVDGYDEPFVELTVADFRPVIGQRVKACAGGNYTVVDCTVVVVER